MSDSVIVIGIIAYAVVQVLGIFAWCWFVKEMGK